MKKKKPYAETYFIYSPKSRLSKINRGMDIFLFIGNTILFRNVAAGGKPSENQYENKKKKDFKVFALGYIAISIHLQPAQQNN